MASAALLEKIKDKAKPFNFVPEDHTYSDDKGWAPSTTQVLERTGFIDLTGIPRDVLERKRDIGIQVHRACEFIDTPDAGGLDWASVAPAVLPYVLGWEKFVDEWNFTPHLVEFGGIATIPCGRVGFTLDRAGVIVDEQGRKMPVIVDLKCAYDEQPSWKYQIAIYELAIESFGIKPQDLVPEWKYPNWLRWSVQLKPDGTYRPHQYESRGDRNVATWAISLATTQINDGIWKRR